MPTFNIDVVVRDKGGGSKDLERQLERLNKTAIRTQKVTERIGRRVRVGGIKKAQRETRKLKREVIGVRSALAAIGIGIGIKELIGKYTELSDTFTNYQNRIKIVTSSTEALNAVTEELFQISDRTRSAFSSTAELFTRVSLATRELGKTQQQVLTFTEDLNKAVILSGASTQEARAGIIQLSQGMAAGALRGDELRSVLEQLPKVADVLAKGMNITRGELRKMGEAGKITADKIFEAFEKASKSIGEDFAKTVPTIGQALVKLENKMIKLVGAVNKATGASELFANAIIFIGDNLPAVSIFVGAFATAFLALGVAAIFASKAATGIFIGLVKLAPFAAAAAVAVGFLSASIQRYNEDVVELDKSNDIVKDSLSTLTAFGTIPGQIASVTRELAQVERVMALTGGTSKVAAERIDTLKFKLAFLNDELKNGGKNTKNAGKEFDAYTKALDVANVSLERSAKLAGMDARARKISIATARELKKALKDIADVTRVGRLDLEAHIKTQLEENQAISDKQKLLEGIKGPQQALIRSTILLNELQKEGAISVGELKIALAGLKEIKLPELPELSYASGGAVLEEVLKRIEVQAAKTGETAAVTFDKMKEALINGAAGADTLREAVTRIEEKSSDAARESGAMAAAIDEVLGKTVSEQYLDSLDDLKFKLDNNLISQRAFNEEVLQLKRNAEGVATTFSSGVSSAFAKAKAEAEDLAAVGEKIVDTFANAAVDAISEFVTKGRLDFKEFAADLLAQIAKIIIRLLVVKALSALTGGTGQVAATVVNTAVSASNSSNQNRQDGGTVQPGRAFVVGENGPEVFKPDRTGTIVPNAKDQKQLAPEVNIGITNVTDPNEVPAAMANGDFDQLIVNVISRQKDAVRQVVQK